MKKLSVIGLGKLGSCTAACFSAKGYHVLGLDLNTETVQAINESKAPLYEPQLQELITESKGRLEATQDYQQVIEETDISFLIVPTPSQSDGHFSDAYLKNALKELSGHLKEQNKKTHLFVITSTVSPGTTEKSLIPHIEKYSGRKLNEGFEICYNPEFIALGSVIQDFLNSELVLIGESSSNAGETLEEIYTKVCQKNPFIARMSIVSAEITKISLNSYVTMKISFANTLSNLCEEIPGSQIDRITKALGQDKRISPYYLKGGLTYGGPCFPRDNRAFAAFAKQYGIEALLAKTSDQVNDKQIERLKQKTIEILNRTKSHSVSILGLAYKVGTPVIEESTAIKLIETLLRENSKLKIYVYDPLALENTKKFFGFENKISYTYSLKECIGNSSLCIFTTQEKEFQKIDSSYIQKTPTWFLDCWRTLDPEKLKGQVQYIALGQHQH